MVNCRLIDISNAKKGGADDFLDFITSPNQYYIYNPRLIVE